MVSREAIEVSLKPDEREAEFKPLTKVGVGDKEEAQDLHDTLMTSHMVSKRAMEVYPKPEVRKADFEPLTLKPIGRQAGGAGSTRHADHSVHGFQGGGRSEPEAR